MALGGVWGISIKDIFINIWKNEPFKNKKRTRQDKKDQFFWSKTNRNAFYIQNTETY